MGEALSALNQHVVPMALIARSTDAIGEISASGLPDDSLDKNRFKPRQKKLTHWQFS